jgi:hypothetical protein
MGLLPGLMWWEAGHRVSQRADTGHRASLPSAINGKCQLGTGKAMKSEALPSGRLVSRRQDWSASEHLNVVWWMHVYRVPWGHAGGGLPPRILLAGEI